MSWLHFLYLQGRKFIIRTDHNSLTWFLKFRNIEDMLARWLEELSEYERKQHGKQYGNADGLSRITERIPYCPNYSNSTRLEDLPCIWCASCDRAQKQFARFEDDIEDVFPLSVRQYAWCSSLNKEELWQELLTDKDSQFRFSWLESEYEPGQEALAVESPTVKKE